MVIFLAVSICASAAPLLSLGKTTAQSGGIALLQLDISGNTESLAGVNANVVLPQGISVVSVDNGSILDNQFITNYRYFPSETAPNSTVITYSGSAAINDTSGTLFTFQLALAPDTPLGTHPVTFAQTNLDLSVNARHALSNSDGSISIPHSVANGSITVVNYPPANYSLTTTSSSGGVVLSPGEGTFTYAENTVVQVSAVAESGYLFSSWTGNVPPGQETVNPLLLSIDSNKNLIANFTPQHTLTIAVNGSGSTNPVPGQYIHPEGSQVTLTATADPGHLFTGWSGSVPPDQVMVNPLTLTVDADKNVNANFSIKRALTLTINGTGTTAPLPGNYSYSNGTVITITATPDTDFLFSGWSGDLNPAQANDNPINLLMDVDRQLVTNFAAARTLILIAEENGTTNPEPGIYSVVDGESVTITAVPYQGYIFNGWQGNLSAEQTQENPLIFVINTNHELTARFNKKGFFWPIFLPAITSQAKQ